MREFVVVMRGGTRFVVKAARVFSDEMYVRLVVPITATSDEPIAVGVPVGAHGEMAPAQIEAAEMVALFNRQEVVAVLSREHLASESQVARNDEIPF